MHRCAGCIRFRAAPACGKSTRMRTSQGGCAGPRRDALCGPFFARSGSVQRFAAIFSARTKSAEKRSLGGMPPPGLRAAYRRCFVRGKLHRITGLKSYRTKTHVLFRVREAAWQKHRKAWVPSRYPSALRCFLPEPYARMSGTGSAFSVFIGSAVLFVGAVCADVRHGECLFGIHRLCGAFLSEICLSVNAPGLRVPVRSTLRAGAAPSSACGPPHAAPSPVMPVAPHACLPVSPRMAGETPICSLWEPQQSAALP